MKEYHYNISSAIIMNPNMTWSNEKEDRRSANDISIFRMQTQEEW